MSTSFRCGPKVIQQLQYFVCTSGVLILTTQLLEDVSHTVEEVDYTEAKGPYNLTKNCYADKLPSELNT